jgi:energy-coupling factor transporter ATP-binding protein EcfA2
MNGEFPSKAVYAYIGPEIPSDANLHCSLLLVLKDDFFSQLPRLIAELYWYGPDRTSRYLGKTNLVRGPDQKSIVVDARRTERIISFSELQQMLLIKATFIGRRKVYRELIDIAGDKLAKKLLINANDAAALQAFLPNSRILQRLRTEEFFERILITEEEQFSFISLQKIFSENAIDHFSPAEIASFSAQLNIDGQSTFNFVADYEEIFGETQPITAVIGANGVGKTRLLLALAKAALDKNLTIRNTSGNSYVDSFAASPFLLSFTYETSLWTWARRRTGAKVINLGVGGREWKQLSAIVLQLANSDNVEFQINAYCQVISNIVDPSELMVPIAEAARYPDIIRIDKQNYLPLPALALNPARFLLGQLQTGQEVIAWSDKLGRYSLSSGQRSLLLLLAQLFLHGERSLVLIDEPENHLHPQFITLLMKTLQSTLIAKESRAVIVTHSPFVIRELDKSAVQILGKDRDLIPCIYQSSLQTFGGDIGQISNYVFGDLDVKKGYEQRIERALAINTSGTAAEVLRRFSPALGEDAELYLHRLLGKKSDAN